jgi:outer membrane protein TolC
MGCRGARSVDQSNSFPLGPDVRQISYETAGDSPTERWGVDLGGAHPVETYIQYALAQNPEIQFARLRVDAATHRVPQARSLEDPMLVIDTQAPPTMPKFGIGVSQKFPWLGKLRTRADAAQWNVHIAGAELIATELSVVEEVKKAYYELHYVEGAILITEADRTLLDDLAKIAESRYRTGSVTQQDVLRAQVAVANLETELVRFQQELQTAQARLARRLHVSPETPLRAMTQLPPEQIPFDLNRLYQQALAARPELHAQMASIERERRAADLAKMEYIPDATVSFGWMDMPQPEMPNDPYAIGVMVNLPVYRKRIDAGVREAQANVAAEARQYDALHDQTMEEVKDLFARAQSQEEMLRLFRDSILPKADQTLVVSRQAYQAGDVDFLQLFDNWRELLKFQLAHLRLEVDLRQTLAELERVVGGFQAFQSVEATPEPSILSPPPFPQG